MKTYPHIAAAILERPWAIERAMLRVITGILLERMQGVEVSAEEIAERIGAPRTERRGHWRYWIEDGSDQVQWAFDVEKPVAAPTRRGNQASAGAVAVLPLYGVIMQRAGMLAQTSGAVSLESWMQDFRSLVADDEIGTIVMDIDSPGGEVSGVPEAAAEIRAARDSKRIVAVANATAASGAYWLGSQAGEFYVTPSGWVGSIGVYTAHEDLSAFWENEGVKTTLISAGKFKVEGNEYEPLSDEALAYRQGIVDDYYGMFVADVAKGRKVPEATVRSGMGEGRMVLANGSIAEKMTDGVMTLDDAIRKSLAPPRPSGSRVLAPAGIFDGSDAVGDPPHEPEPAAAEPAVEPTDEDAKAPQTDLDWYRYRARARGRRR